MRYNQKRQSIEIDLGSREYAVFRTMLFARVEDFEKVAAETRQSDPSTFPGNPEALARVFDEQAAEARRLIEELEQIEEDAEELEEE
jgi:hypothetical protein